MVACALHRSLCNQPTAHMRQMVADLDVNGYAKRVNAVTFCLDYRLAVIFDTVSATVGIVVIRFAVRQCDE